MPDDRTCSRCPRIISQKSRTGVCNPCKTKQWKQENKERVRGHNQKHYAEHREEKLAKAKEAYDPVAKKQWRSKYYQENKEEELARNKAWRNADKQTNPEKWEQKDIEARKKRKDSGYSRVYYQENKERILKQNAEYQANNKEALAAHSRDRYKNDIQFRLRAVLRVRLNEALKNIQKTGSAVDDLGCSIPELKTYLESLFYPHHTTNEPMTWDNWSLSKDGWQIDHTIQLASFDLTDYEQLKKACHFSNLRPLWYKDHLEKSIEERRNSG